MTDLPASVRWQLWIVAFGFFMQSLDTTIVNTKTQPQTVKEKIDHRRGVER
jgi:hypothetical protein